MKPFVAKNIQHLISTPKRFNYMAMKYDKDEIYPIHLDQIKLRSSKDMATNVVLKTSDPLHFD